MRRKAHADQFLLEGLRNALFKRRVVVDQQYLGLFACFRGFRQGGYAETSDVFGVMLHGHAEHEHVARELQRFAVVEGQFNFVGKHQPRHLGFIGNAAAGRLIVCGFLFGQGSFKRTFFGGFECRGVFLCFTQTPLGENFVLRHRCELVEFDFVERHQGKRQVVELGDLGNGGTIKRTDGNLCAGTSGGFELING